MTRHIAVLALLLPCVVIETALADFDEGIAALRRGDYATALTELRPLADQGNAAAQSAIG